jgi:parallel beta-helix repeat protein
MAAIRTRSLIVAIAGILLAGALGTGSAAASTGTLLVTATTTLTEDHHGNILISGDNITLDCAGHAVFGPGTAGFAGGIQVAGGSGLTVRRCTVTGFAVNGIYAFGASHGRYIDNLLVGNGNHGIHLEQGADNLLIGNTSTSNGAIGIVLTHSTQSRIVNNSLLGNRNWAGIALMDGSHDNLVVDNTASQNGLGIVLDGAVDNTVSANTATLNEAAGVLLIRGASGNTVVSNLSNQNGIGFEVTQSSDGNSVLGNLANGNRFDGVKVYASDSNFLSADLANANGDNGFLVFGGSSFNRVTCSSGHGNGAFDAQDTGPGSGNVWAGNHFGTALAIHRFGRPRRVRHCPSPVRQ